MRIIDKNRDYYDFYQGICPDASFIYDRRGSTLLSGSFFSDRLPGMESERCVLHDRPENAAYFFTLLESGYDKWLFAACFHTEPEENGSYTIVRQVLRLADHWQDTEKAPKPLSLSFLDVSHWDMFMREERPRIGQQVPPFIIRGAVSLT